jgi:hypothetical protein
MTSAELNRHAQTAIVKALKDDLRGFDALREYVAGIKDDAALNLIYKASEALGDAVTDVMAEREREGSQ